ncbi:MAG: hypothetical protein IIA11_09750 [Proteobacteria bacterium]|nr:hypothetical protein [Pseudomonadota bacterium]
MKLVSIIALCLLVGCTSRPTLEELEAEALITGDWTEVENRERMDKRWGVVQTESRCFTGFVLVCHKKQRMSIATAYPHLIVQRPTNADVLFQESMIVDRARLP